MSKDVIIAGAIALGCVALIAVAFIAPKKPAETESTKTETITSIPDFGSPTVGTDHGADPSGSLAGGPLPGNTLPGASFTPPPAAPFPTTPGGVGATEPFGATPPAFGAPTGPVAANSAVNSGSQPFGTSPSPFGTTPTTLPPTAPFGTTPTPLPGPTTAATSAPAPTTEAKTHTVAAGELLGDISMKYYGTAKQWKRIVDANPGTDPKNLKVGQKLVIPAAEPKPVESSTATAPTTAPGERTYTIKPGDTLYLVAKHELGSASRWKEIEKLNNISSNDLKVGQVIKLPAAASTSTGPAPTAADPVAPAGAKTHTVAKGENLGDISKHYYGTTRNWKKIVDANPGVSPENLKIGQKLVIPDVAGATTAPAPGGAAPLSPAPAPLPAEAGEYTIKAGDTLGTIAQKELGSKNKWKEIQDANPGLDPRNLRAGQKIKIPGKKAAAPATPAPSPAPAPTPAFPPSHSPAPTPFPGGADNGFKSPYGDNGFGQPAQPFGQPTQPNQPFGQTGPGFGQTGPGPVSDPFAPQPSPFAPAPATQPGAADPAFH